MLRPTPAQGVQQGLAAPAVSNGAHHGFLLRPCRGPQPFSAGVLKASSTGHKQAPVPFALQARFPAPPLRSASAAAAPVTDAVQQSSATDKPQPSSAYPFTEIEGKWQAYWEEHQTFRTPDKVDTSKPKYYVLDMFPYPR